MTQLLEVADREFKPTIIDILRNLTKKVNIMQEDMGNQKKISKNQVKTVELKNTISAEKRLMNLKTS